MITESLAARGWPGQDPIGRRLHFGGPQATANKWRTIVGVDNDVRTQRLEDAPRPLLYLLFGVGGADPIAFVTGAVVLVVVAALAAYLLAHRASRIEPMVALSR